MTWLLVVLGIVALYCACRVSGDADDAAGELERALRERSER